MKSIRGVYYDLSESDYVFEYKDMKFYFSSQFYLNKFITKYKDFVSTESLKQDIYFNATGNYDRILLLKLYRQIEKRGFRVIYKNRYLQIPYNLVCEVI